MEPVQVAKEVVESPVKTKESKSEELKRKSVDPVEVVEAQVANGNGNGEPIIKKSKVEINSDVAPDEEVKEHTNGTPKESSPSEDEKDEENDDTQDSADGHTNGKAEAEVQDEKSNADTNDAEENDESPADKAASGDSSD